MNYYVYAYLRTDGTPYYIGKGKGYRAWQSHKRGGIQMRPADYSRIIMLMTNISDEDAMQFERYMIAYYGRKDVGAGILQNMTDGGDGTSGVLQSQETRAKRSKSLKGRPSHNKGRPSHNKGKIAYNKGKQASIETRAKMRTAQSIRREIERKQTEQSKCASGLSAEQSVSTCNKGDQQ